MLLAIRREERHDENGNCEDRFLWDHNSKDGLCYHCDRADNARYGRLPVLHNLTSNDGKNVRGYKNSDPRLQLDFFVCEDRALGER